MHTEGGIRDCRLDIGGALGGGGGGVQRNKELVEMEAEDVSLKSNRLISLHPHYPADQ